MFGIPRKPAALTISGTPLGPLAKAMKASQLRSMAALLRRDMCQEFNDAEARDAIEETAAKWDAEADVLSPRPPDEPRR